MGTLFNKAVEKVSSEKKAAVSKAFDIVDQIACILERKKMTQKELAVAMGKSESEISKWMRGTHNFTIDTISKIETILGEPILLTPIRFSIALSSAREQLINDIRKNVEFEFKISISELSRQQD